MNDEEEKTVKNSNTQSASIDNETNTLYRLIEEKESSYLISSQLEERHQDKAHQINTMEEPVIEANSVLPELVHAKKKLEIKRVNRDVDSSSYVMMKRAHKETTQMNPSTSMTPVRLARSGASGGSSSSISSISIHDHLIKLAMFLVTLACHSWCVNCQSSSKQQQQLYEHMADRSHLYGGGQLRHEQMVLQQLMSQQRQQLGKLMSFTGATSYQQQLQMLQMQQQQQRMAAAADRLATQARPQPADRRASGPTVAPQPLPAVISPGQQQQQQVKSGSGGQQRQQTSGQQQKATYGSKNEGKLLVCYYTTRQAAPYWPTKETREFVFPVTPDMPLADLATQTPFAPILHYEPFAVRSSGEPNLAPQSGPELNGLNNINIKNQQQQLVFKSASVQLMPQRQQTGGQLGGQVGAGNGLTGAQSAKAQAGAHNGNKSKQHQDAISQLLAEQQQQHHLQLGSSQPSLIIVGQQATGDIAAGGKNKQTPAYSFIGDLDSTANNGLIVGGRTSGAGAPGSQQVAHDSGNNGNNFIISNKDNNSNNGNHLERSATKQAQAQQLVFAPALSRAFIVGGGGGGGGTTAVAAQSSAGSSDALDTKSQLFIAASKAHNNNQYQQQQQQQQAGTTGAPVPAAAQASATAVYELPKAKSLQQQQALGVAALAGGDQLSPSVHPFSGQVSSTPPVPLSSASSTQLALQQMAPTLPYRSHQQQQQHQLHLLQLQQHQAAANQHLVGNGGGGGPPGASSSLMKPVNVIGGSTAALKLTYSPADGAGLPGSSGKSPTPLATSSLTSTSTPTTSGTSGTTTSGASSPPSPSSSSATPSSSSLASLSPALGSSPLSTMLDVFGAASQYLMRFKPSSLISPAALTFSTISNEHQQHGHHNHQAHQTNSKTSATANSSLLGSISSLPLHFATSLQQQTNGASQAQKSAIGGDRATSSPATGSGILSRFALQNNQRREDVCGRTIQTPQRRIIGGEGARYGEFPYQVHIKIAKHQCGGALVDKQSIVTAAHCVYHFITRAPVSKLQIVIGAYDIEDEQYQELPPQYFKVNKVKLHPNFRFSASHPDRYDIAILKLDKPVKYTDNVLPVCLPNKDLKFESVVGTVTGFGKTDPSLSNRYGTRLLQKVDVPIIENNECERWHRTRGIDLKIFPEMMCAGYEDGLKDACVGDSGGPLVVKSPVGPNGSFRWTLAGITSAGFGCAQSRQPDFQVTNHLAPAGQLAYAPTHIYKQVFTIASLTR